MTLVGESARTAATPYKACLACCAAASCAAWFCQSESSVAADRPLPIDEVNFVTESLIPEHSLLRKRRRALNPSADHTCWLLETVIHSCDTQANVLVAVHDNTLVRLVEDIAEAELML